MTIEEAQATLASLVSTLPEDRYLFCYHYAPYKPEVAFSIWLNTSDPNTSTTFTISNGVVRAVKPNKFTLVDTAEIIKILQEKLL